MFLMQASMLFRSFPILRMIFYVVSAFQMVINLLGTYEIIQFAETNGWQKSDFVALSYLIGSTVANLGCYLAIYDRNH